MKQTSNRQYKYFLFSGDKTRRGNPLEFFNIKLCDKEKWGLLGANEKNQLSPQNNKYFTFLEVPNHLNWESLK